MSNIHFGILGAGGIANQFARAAAMTEGADVTAVASRTPGKAADFAARHSIPVSCDSYEAMLARDDVDCVYIATTHNFHKENILLCLNAGKHVLCEKPMVLTAADARECFDLAREKNLFLMEAMWSRFLPSYQKAREWIREGCIGEVQAVSGVIGFRAGNDPKHRLLNPDLAGGAMYDIGVYALEVASFLMGEPIVDVQFSRRNHALTGVDACVSMIVQYPSADAVLQCLFTSNAKEYVVVNGTKGFVWLPVLHVADTAYLHGADRREVEKFHAPHENGFVYEVEEVVRCIREGRITSDVMPPEATIECAEVFDRVLG